jgi:LPXTG-motif cell wall-anchored protein
MVKVTKNWADQATNSHELDSVTVHLLDAAGNRLDDQYAPIELNDANNWYGEWTALPEGEYYVEEEDIDGYDSFVTCSQTTSDSYFVPVSNISSDGTYLFATSSNSSSSYLYLLGTSSYGTSYPVERSSSYYTKQTGSLSLGGKTYTGGYLKSSSIPDSARWTVRLYPEYDGFALISQDNGYALGISSNYGYTYSSTASILQWNPSSSGAKTGKLSYSSYWMQYNSGYLYVNASASESDAQTFSIYKEVSAKTYDYKITNTQTNEDAPPKVLLSAEDYTKNIDYLGDNSSTKGSGTNNPDTLLDDSTAKMDLTDLYRLYLNIGPMELNCGVDLLLVVDQSYSMKETANYYGQELQRDEILNRILNGYGTQEGLISEFLGLHEDNRIAVVRFDGNPNTSSTDYSTDSDYYIQWTSNQNTTVSITAQDHAVNGTPKGAGTNYSAGLLKAGTAWDQKTSSKNKKLMVFLSDGVPTYGVVNATKDGSGYRAGTGYANDLDNVVKCKGYAMDSFDAFHNMYPDVTVYTVGFGTDVTSADGGLSTDPAVLRYMANISGGLFINANDGDTMRRSLERYILGGGKYTNVTIQDTLSEYVDYYESQPELKVTMRQKTTESKNATVIWSGDAAVSGYENIIKSVSYDAAARTVTVVFNPNYSLETDYIYELSFNVRTTDTAYNKMAANLASNKNPYWDRNNPSAKGDAETDYPGNATSSGQYGFRSNKNATFSFVQADEPGTRTYDHPVVQVSNCDLSIKKVSQDNGVLLGDAVFDLYRRTYTGENNDAKTGGDDGDVPQLPPGNYVEVKQNIRTGGEGGNQLGYASVQDLSPGEYYLVEKEAPDGYALPAEAFHFTLFRSTVTVDQPATGQVAMTEGSDTEAVLTVKNKVNLVLPQTGGSGTTWYTLSGALLVLMSSMIMYKKRKEGSRD